MAYTKRQIVTVASAIFLVVLTVVASYALHLIRYYSLPIPTLLGAFAVGLPAITGLSMESASEFRRRPVLPESQKSTAREGTSNYVTIVTSILLVLETAVAALSGTYLAPARSLTCGLNDEWLRLFRAKRGDMIRRIQNNFQCCGLHSVKDMAYPFPTNVIDPRTCSTRYERTSSCFGRWRQEEQKAAGLILLVTVLVFLWKMLIITDPFSQTQRSWLHSILPPRWRSSRDAEYGSSDTRALEPPSDNDRYHDDTEAGAESLAGAVPTASIPDSRNPSMSPTLASRVQPSGLGAASRNEEGWGHGDG